MDTKRKTEDVHNVSLTSKELVLLNNALNEVCNGIAMSDDEFLTRLGVDRKTARALLKHLGQLLPP